MKRRVEAESFEEEAREKDLSLAEVVQIVVAKTILSLYCCSGLLHCPT